MSQWEGNRANELLRAIPGGAEFADRTYIDIKADHISEDAFFSIVEDNNMDMAVFSYEQLYKQLVNK